MPEAQMQGCRKASAGRALRDTPGLCLQPAAVISMSLTSGQKAWRAEREGSCPSEVNPNSGESLSEILISVGGNSSMGL